MSALMRIFATTRSFTKRPRERGNHEEVDSDGLLRRSRRVPHSPPQPQSNNRVHALRHFWSFFLSLMVRQRPFCLITKELSDCGPNNTCSDLGVGSASLCLAVKKLWKEREGRPLHPNPWGQSWSELFFANSRRAPKEYGENREILSETNGTAACDHNQAIRGTGKYCRTSSHWLKSSTSTIGGSIL